MCKGTPQQKKSTKLDANTESPLACAIFQRIYRPYLLGKKYCFKPGVLNHRARRFFSWLPLEKKN